MLIKPIRQFIYSPACASTLNKLLALAASLCFLLIAGCLFWLADGYLVFEGWDTASWLFLCTTMFLVGCISSLVLAVFLEYRIVEHIVKVLGIDVSKIMEGDRLKIAAEVERTRAVQKNLSDVVTVLSHSHDRVEKHCACPVCGQGIPTETQKAAAGYFESLWNIATK